MKIAVNPRSHLERSLQFLFWVVGALGSASSLRAGGQQGRHPKTQHAPRDQMIVGSWSSANKQAFGTSYETYDVQGRFSRDSTTAPISRVWFTAAQGVLTEVFWPTLDTAQLRDSQFLVTDGESFFFEERRDSVTQVERVMAGVPAFRIRNEDPRGRFVIEKTLFSDPDRNVVLQHVKMIRHVPGLKFYLLHSPQVGNTPMGNSAQVIRDPSGNAVLGAWQGDQAQVVVASIPMKKASAAFSGPYDGFRDLQNDFVMDFSFESADRGNVALTAWMDIPEEVGSTEWDLAVGFGSSVREAAQSARESLDSNPQGLLQKFIQDWLSYQNSLQDVSLMSSDGGQLFRNSIAVLKSSEDKTYAGAFVASPSVPWGQHEHDNNQEAHLGSRGNLVSGYHVVWPRDLYQTATTFMAVRDYESALASLRYLQRIQYPENSGEWRFGSRHIPKAGTFPQNCWVNGEAFWPGLQMDEVAFPVILAYRLWKSGRVRWEDVWSMVNRATDHIATHGPWSPQERWEENFGASPSTIAAMIAALWGASEIAVMAGDSDRAEWYQKTADHWSSHPGDNVDSWTFTTTGIHGSGRYYERVEGASSPDQKWDPNDNAVFVMANGAGSWHEKDVTDAGFLELVRWGVRSARHTQVIESLVAVDDTIRKDLPNIGAGFYRYLGDRYNRDDRTGERTRGMLWPLLTGERGHYEIARAVEEGRSYHQIAAIATPYIQAMERMASPTGMIPEQVWDAGSLVGLSTGSATPLAWSHAEYVKLLRSTMDGKPFDLIETLRQHTRILLDE